MEGTEVNRYLQELSIFRVGEVCSVDGRAVSINVDKDKNLSHLIYKGESIRNVSVGSYLKILKGFTILVAKVESEYIKEDKNVDPKYHSSNEVIDRRLIVKLLGYFENGQYHKGVKELPLIGNECLLLTNGEYSSIHKFAQEKDLTIKIGNLLVDENVPIEIGINKLFTSHIGIFGNTGSGKSYTLANLYKLLFDKVANNKKFQENAKFLIFDFNGEYSEKSVITKEKHVYKLTTRDSDGDKIPLKDTDLLNPELFYILASATEKTQQPFIRRAFDLYKSIFGENNNTPQDEALNHFKNLTRIYCKKIFMLKDALRAKTLLDYADQILGVFFKRSPDGTSLASDLEPYSNGSFRLIGTDKYVNAESVNELFETINIGRAVNGFVFKDDFLSKMIDFLYLRMIMDVIENRANNEHIAPAINKLRSFRKDFSKVFIVDNKADFWNNSFLCVIDLNKVNLNMRKLIPLLISFKLYAEHKDLKVEGIQKSLNLIIDEAHNILSYESMRESESWKDFRLETFEEIIKEGRKFGVFLTLASQRPSDISATIVSQLHNYFIHRLVNNKDLEMIEKAVSYLDKLSVESLPILPVGACVLSGLIADLPVVIQVDRLPSDVQPNSTNISLLDNWIDNEKKH